jgi:hypothetical protein
MANIREVTFAKDEAMRKCQDLEDEARRLQQEIEVKAVKSQQQITWSDIQPMLQQTHVSLLSAAHGVWSTMGDLENKRLASFLPGPGVYQGPLLDQTAPVGVLDHGSLPNQPLPQPANVVLGDSQLPY